MTQHSTSRMRRLRHRGSGQNRGMTLLHLLGTTAALAVFTVLGISTAGGTYALLSASHNSGAATVTSGTLTLQVNGAATSALGAFAVSPATPHVRSFTVTNTGDAPASLSAGITAVTSGIGGYATARLTPVPSAAACQAGLSGVSSALNGYQASAGDLEPGRTEVLCLEVALASATPATLSGQSVAFTLTMTATQKER